MVAAVAGGVPVKGALLLPTVRLPPGVRTPRQQVHHDSLSQHPAVLAPAQYYSLVHSPAVHRGKRTSAPTEAREGAGAWLLLRKCRTVTRATMGAASVLLLRTLVGTVAVVATAVLMMRRRCTVAAVAPLAPNKAREGAWIWLLRRITRDIIAGSAAVALRWGGNGWHVRIYAIALEEVITAQMPKPTTGVAESVKPPWLSRCAHLRLMPGLSASLVPDSRSRAAVMFPINFHRSVLSGGGGSPEKQISTNQCTNLDYFRSRRPYPPTSVCAVYKSLE